MSYVAVVKGRYGNLLYWNRDIVIGSGIAAYHEYFESEVDVFRRYVRAGDGVIDCGANVGAHTIALASIVGTTGAVMAVEPQRPMFYVMCANAILNGYINVHPVLAAAGNRSVHAKFIEPDYTRPNSFGGFETTPRAEVNSGVRIHVERLDKLWANALGERAVQFMKIDVEGQECEAVLGASKIIKRDQPIIYVENDRRENSRALIMLLRCIGYDVYWHIARFYNPKNFAGRPDDIPMNHYGWVDGKINGAALMLLCLPKEKNLPLFPDLRKVESDDEYPPFE